MDHQDRKITEWKDLFSEICWAYDRHYNVIHDVDVDGTEYVMINKLTITSKGEGNYKTDNWTFDPALWPRVKLFCKLFEKGNTIDILYGKNEG